MSGRSEISEQGGHVVCLRDKDIGEIKSDVALIKKRMFYDNGHESIQTSLVTGAARFRSIDERMTALSAGLSSLTDAVRQSNNMQQGMAGEGLTTEGLVRQVLKQMPRSGHSNTWIALSVICVCITVIVLKVW